MEAVSVAEWALIVKPRSRAEKNRFIRNREYAVRKGNLNCKFKYHRWLADVSGQGMASRAV
jgi:hypothetical protein